jgi:hypothetical protein
LRNGQSLLQHMRMEHVPKPVMFVVGHGRKPVSMSMALLAKPESLADAVRKAVINKHMKIGNAGDLEACVRDRLGGCLVVYTSRPADAVAAELPAVMGAGVGKVMKVGLLHSKALALRPAPDSPLHRLLGAAIKYAKADAAAAAGFAEGEEVPRTASVPGAEVILLARRAPKEAGLAPGSVVITVGNTARPGTLGAGDVEALAQAHNEAVDLLAASAAKAPPPPHKPKPKAAEDDFKEPEEDVGGDGDAGAATAESTESTADATERLLERDAALERLQSTVISDLKADVKIVAASSASKAKAAKAKQQQDQQQRARQQQQEQQQQEQQARKPSSKRGGDDAHGGGSADTGDSGDMTAAQRRERRERLKRDKERSQAQAQAQKEKEREREAEEDTPEAAAERERRARANMARAEAESAHIAHAAGEEDDTMVDVDIGADASQHHEEWPENIDLDAQGERDDELESL